MLTALLLFFGFCFLLCMLASDIDFSGFLFEVLGVIALTPIAVLYAALLALIVVAMYFVVKKVKGSRSLWATVTTLELTVCVFLGLIALSGGGGDSVAVVLGIQAGYCAFSCWYAGRKPAKQKSLRTNGTNVVKAPAAAPKSKETAERKAKEASPPSWRFDASRREQHLIRPKKPKSPGQMSLLNEKRAIPMGWLVSFFKSH